MKKVDNSYEFRILDEVSKGGELTQRSLSKRLGVALGLTNLYIKRLAKKGYIKVVNIKPGRLRYELTPSGIAQKAALAFQYIQDSYVFYQEARRNLTRMFDMIKVSGTKAVVLYGVGEIAEIALLSLQEVEIEVVGVVSLKHAGEALCGKPIHSLMAITSMNYDRVVAIDRQRDEALKLLTDLGVEPTKIVWIG